MGVLNLMGSIDAYALPNWNGMAFDASAQFSIEVVDNQSVLVMDGYGYQQGTTKVVLDGSAISTGTIETGALDIPEDVVSMGITLEYATHSQNADSNFDRVEFEYALQVSEQTGTSTVLHALEEAAGTQFEITLVDQMINGQQTVLVSPEDNAAGAYLFSYDGENLTQQEAFHVQNSYGDHIEFAAHGVDNINSVTVGSETYILTSSEHDLMLRTYRVSDDGGLELVDEIASAEDRRFGANQVHNSIVLEENGSNARVVLGSDSGLHTLDINANGQMSFAHRVNLLSDSGATSAQMMDKIEVNGQTFLAVADGEGSNDVALMTVLPDGRMVHLQNVNATDVAGTSNLTNIKNIELVENGDHVDLFVMTGDEDAIWQFRLDTTNPGSTRVVTVNNSGTDGDDMLMVEANVNDGVTIRGEGGNDVIADGNGADHLFGGDGADVFVFTGDRETDVIHDFDVTEDRIDLSGIRRYFGSENLNIVQTHDGAKLIHNDETLILKSADGGSISIRDLEFALDDPMRRVIPEYDDEYFASIKPVYTTDEGTAGGDVFEGTAGNDIMTGGAGNDTFKFSEGNDFVDGGEGRDVLDYSNATDQVMLNLDEAYKNAGVARLVVSTFVEDAVGGDYNDGFWANSEGSSIWGGKGDDTFFGGIGDDVFFGGEGADRFEDSGGFDIVDYANLSGGVVVNMQEPTRSKGEAEGDSFGQFIEAVRGTDSNDQITGNAQANWLFGGKGDDVIEGDAGDGHGYNNDHLYGGEDDDKLFGGQNNDLLFGGAGNDLLSGGEGSDRLFGGDGHNILIDTEGNMNRFIGGSGVDEVLDGVGHAVIYTAGGNDIIRAGAGQDRIFGGDGDDSIDGDAGSDTITGGAGNDTLHGGDLERDVFVFRADMDQDVIKDYEGDNLLFTEELLGFRFEAGNDEETMLEVLEEFAVVADEGVEFDFGNGNSLLLEGLNGFGDLHEFMMVTEF